jgi:hypothetical protein
MTVIRAAAGFPTTAWGTEIVTALPSATGPLGPATAPICGFVLNMPKTVPLNSVILEVLVLSKTTLKRPPPDTVPSRLSVVFLTGTAPPLLRTATQLPLLKYVSSLVSSAIVDG